MNAILLVTVIIKVCARYMRVTAFVIGSRHISHIFSQVAVSHACRPCKVSGQLMIVVTLRLTAAARAAEIFYVHSYTSHQLMAQPVPTDV